MKAAVITEKQVIRAMDVPKPELAPGEALIKVKYAGICGSDMHLYHGAYAKAGFPVIPGHEFVGELVEVNGGATDGINIGDIVAAEPTVGCGVCVPCLEGRENGCPHINIIGIYSDGGFAEYVKAPSRNLVRLRPGCDLKLAALMEPLAVACHDIRASGLRLGQKVLVIGSGPIGMLIAMVARKGGASLVALSEVNDYRIDFARKAGFETLDGRAEDFKEQAMAMTDGNGFDIVFECSGTGIGVNNSIELCRTAGTIVQVGMGFGSPNINIFDITYREIVIKGVRIHPMKDFKEAAELFNSGILDDDLELLVTKVFDLGDITQAFRYQEEDAEHFKVLVQMH